MSTYDITIDNASFAANTAPRDGFFDPVSTYTYMNTVDDAFPTNLAASAAKSKANDRYRKLVLALVSLGSAIELSRTLTGGDINAPHSSITLRFRFNSSLVSTEDEVSGGEDLVNEDAIKRVVARVMTIERSRTIEVYDPTDITIINNGTEITIPRGITIGSYTIGNIAETIEEAEAAITVTAV